MVFGAFRPPWLSLAVGFRVAITLTPNAVGNLFNTTFCFEDGVGSIEKLNLVNFAIVSVTYYFNKEDFQRSFDYSMSHVGYTGYFVSL